MAPPLSVRMMSSCSFSGLTMTTAFEASEAAETMSYGDGTYEHQTECTLSFARFSGLNLTLNNVFFLAISSSPELFRCVTIVKAALLSLRRGRRRRRERQRGGAPPQGRSRSFSFRSTRSRGPRRRGQRPASSFATLLSGHKIAAKNSHLCWDK